MSSRRWLGALVVALVLTAAILAVLPEPAATTFAVLATVAVLVVARRRGLTADDLGLAREHLVRGVQWALGCLVLVAAAYAVVLAVPATRALLVDDRASDDLAALAVRVLIVIPLHTVLLEEITFRGALWGGIARDRGMLSATVISSLLFGLWHLGSAGGALEGNEAAGDVVGGSPLATVAGMAGIVLVTAVAGALLCWLRMRSRSLLAPIGLHWAANALGTIAVYVASGS